MAKVPLNK